MRCRAHRGDGVLRGVAARAEERARPVNVVLAGNPNAGKTTLFNALTHSRLRTGNYHGVTTTAASKTVDGIIYTDVPGIYTFNSYTMEEKEAYAATESADIIVNVVDALTLESSLKLTRRLISLNRNTVVYLTKCDSLRARGGRVDEQKLSAFLGVPVFSGSAKRLKSAIKGGDIRPVKRDENMPFAEAYYGGNRQLGRFESLFYNRIFALVAFVLILTATFFVTFYPDMPGAYLKGLFEELIFEKFSSAVLPHISSPQLSSLVGEGIIGGVGGVLSFIPQITILYAALVVLDESGISSALSFVTDGLFEKVGLSGKAAFSLVSGFGCTAAAIATTRGFALERSRAKTIAVLPYIPCGAKMPVFLTFLSPLFKNPFPAICALYFGGILLAIALSAIIGGKGEGLISEVTPVALPRLSVTLKKLYFYVQSFIIKVTTYVFIFCIISWLLSHYSFGGYCSPADSILGSVSRVVVVLFYPMGITDWRYAYALVTGFAAKENIAATISMLIPEGVSLAVAPTAAICVFVLTCPACISAFASSVREIGFKKTLKFNAAQLAFAFITAYLTYFILLLI